MNGVNIVSNYKDKLHISDDELRQVSGGGYDSGAQDSSEVPGSIDYPIMLETDEKVRRFTDIAKKYDFRISVSDRTSSVDGRDYAAVLALNRSGFLHVMAGCRNSDPFASELDQFMVY